MTGTVSPLWYATRATGVMALVLLTATVLLGVATAAGAELPGIPRVITGALHRNLSLLVMVFVAGHVLTTVLDSYTSIGLTAAFIPFGSPYRGFWLGLGEGSRESSSGGRGRGGDRQGEGPDAAEYALAVSQRPVRR